VAGQVQARGRNFVGERRVADLVVDNSQFIMFGPKFEHAFDEVGTRVSGILIGLGFVDRGVGRSIDDSLRSESDYGALDGGTREYIKIVAP
jgi:hypothetical protein